MSLASILAIALSATSHFAPPPKPTADVARQPAAKSEPPQTQEELIKRRDELKLQLTRYRSIATRELRTVKYNGNFTAAYRDRKELESRLDSALKDVAQAEDSVSRAEANVSLQESMLSLATDANRAVVEQSLALAEQTLGSAQADLNSANDAVSSIMRQLAPLRKILERYTMTLRKLEAVERRINGLHDVKRD